MRVWGIFIYSRVPNCGRGTLINFQTFFAPLHPYQTPYAYWVLGNFQQIQQKFKNDITTYVSNMLFLAKSIHFIFLKCLKVHTPALIQDPTAIQFHKKSSPYANSRPYSNQGHQSSYLTPPRYRNGTVLNLQTMFERGLQRLSFYYSPNYIVNSMRFNGKSYSNVNLSTGNLKKNSWQSLFCVTYLG